MFMKSIKRNFFAFIATFVFGFLAFWTVMITLSILDAKNIINKWNLDSDTRENILDIQCDKDDAICRGEKCHS